MKIEVVHTIKFDTKSEGLINLVAQAILGAVSQEPVSAGVDATEDAVKNDAPAAENTSKPNVATKLCYFRHEGTGDLITVKKGESLDFLDTDIFDPLTVAEFNRLKTEQAKAAKEEEAKKTATESEQTKTDEDAVELDIADLRVVASKFVSAAKQKELKELFGEFNDSNGTPAVKLSAIQVSDYQAFMDRAKERLAELGVE